jgi:predicted amidophosphoribosyltransferase
MHKNEEGVFEPHMTKYPFSKSIYLVDDQLTKGNNAKKCVELLHEMGVWNIKLFTWTSSKFQEMN